MEQKCVVTIPSGLRRRNGQFISPPSYDCFLRGDHKKRVLDGRHLVGNRIDDNIFRIFEKLNLGYVFACKNHSNPLTKSTTELFWSEEQQSTEITLNLPNLQFGIPIGPNVSKYKWIRPRCTFLIYG